MAISAPRATLLHLQRRGVTNKTVNLSWNALDQTVAQGFVVKYTFTFQVRGVPYLTREVGSDQDTLSGKCAETFSGTVKTFSPFSGLEPATDYTISMKACTVVGCTEMTDRLSIKTLEGRKWPLTSFFLLVLTINDRFLNCLLSLLSPLFSFSAFH